MKTLETRKLPGRLLFTFFLLCHLFGCRGEIKNEDTYSGLIYRACLVDALQLSRLRDDTTKMILFMQKPFTNIGLSGDMYLDEPVVKNLIQEDPSWKVFIEQIEIEKVLSDSILQSPGFSINSESIFLDRVDIRPIVVDWESHRSQYPNSLGIVKLSSILYSKNKSKAMLEIRWVGGRLSGFEVLYLVEIGQEIKIKYKRELAVS